MTPDCNAKYSIMNGDHRQHHHDPGNQPNSTLHPYHIGLAMRGPVSMATIRGNNAQGLLVGAPSSAMVGQVMQMPPSPVRTPSPPVSIEQFG